MDYRIKQKVIKRKKFKVITDHFTMHLTPLAVTEMKNKTTSDITSLHLEWASAEQHYNKC